MLIAVAGVRGHRRSWGRRPRSPRPATPGRPRRLAATEPAPSPTATPASRSSPAGDRHRRRPRAARRPPRHPRRHRPAQPQDGSRPPTSALVGPLTTDARGVATFRALPGRTTTYRVDYAGDDVRVAAGVRRGHRLRAPARDVLGHREGLPWPARASDHDGPPGAPGRHGHHRAMAGRRLGRVAQPHARRRLPRADHLARRRRRRLAAARRDAGRRRRTSRARSRVRRVEVVEAQPVQRPPRRQGHRRRRHLAVPAALLLLRQAAQVVPLRDRAAGAAHAPRPLQASTPGGCGRAGRTARGSCPTTRRAPSTAPTSRSCSSASRATSPTAARGSRTRTPSGSTTTRRSARRCGTCR